MCPNKVAEVRKDITYRVTFGTLGLCLGPAKGRLSHSLAILITLGLGTMSQLPIVPLQRFPDLHVNSCLPDQEGSSM